jgi:hypothetical protein
MRWFQVPVKQSNVNSRRPGLAGLGGRRWLRGWELAIPSVGMAVIAAWLAVPRPTEPRSVPHPLISPRKLGAALSGLERRAERITTAPLSFTVREVGEAYRRLGRTEYDGPDTLSRPQVEAWRQIVFQARRKVGDDELLTLRAVQSGLFAKAVDSWRTTGDVPEDIIELGGDLVRLAQANHW